MVRVLFIFSSKLLTVLSGIAPIKAIFVDNGHSIMAGAVKEAPLVVRTSVSLVHFSFLNLPALPHSFVLDALNLNGLERDILGLSSLTPYLLTLNGFPP